MSGKQSADEQIKWWWNGITYQMRLRSNDQTRLEKDGMDVENTSVTGSSKQPTLLDMNLLNKTVGLYQRENYYFHKDNFRTAFCGTAE